MHPKEWPCLVRERRQACLTTVDGGKLCGCNSEGITMGILVLREEKGSLKGM